ncbi:MAG: F0F1 ATP synthase subunit B [Sulfurospirillum sp.]|nr:F0F1 ATP synthase subunit B [Sulfurospirillum sp.]
MKSKIILFMMNLPVLALASEGGTDIVPRAINFLIFAGIMYYLVAQHAKDFFIGRKDGIAQRLSSIQAKVKESSLAKEKAQLKVEEAKAQAKSLVETAKREAELISEKLVNDTRVEIQNLEKAYTDKTQIQRRKLTREVVEQILNEVFVQTDMALNKDELVSVVMKKVA